MLVLQFKCDRCLAVFEQLFAGQEETVCLCCGNTHVQQLKKSLFNKLGGCSKDGGCRSGGCGKSGGGCSGGCRSGGGCACGTKK